MLGCMLHSLVLPNLSTDVHIFHPLTFLFKAFTSFSLFQGKGSLGVRGAKVAKRSEKMGVLWCGPLSETYSHGCWTFVFLKLEAGTQGPRYSASTLSLSHTQVHCLPTLGLLVLASSSISLSFHIFDLGETTSRMRVERTRPFPAWRVHLPSHH